MAHDERRIYSVIGTLPEPGGYAIAKFSRSARPYQEWIQELTQEGASRFYEQFYFAYGHASIADLAHLTLVAENISIVAAIDVLDEQLVDAQESSTRYQDFSRRRYYTPPEILGTPLEPDYRRLCDLLFDTYRDVHRAALAHYEQVYADRRPPTMGDDEYRRTMRARAFDVARYLLPSSTYTGLGYLCSARTLERQISRLASSPLGEIREIAAELRRATTEPALNPLSARISPAIDEYLEAHPDDAAQSFVEQVRNATLTGAAAAPTLVRYTEARPYPESAYRRMRLEADELTKGIAPEAARGVTLAEPLDAAAELAATLLYRVSDLSYEQIASLVRSLPQSLIDEIGALAFADRGPHDDPPREARVGYQLVFDVCLDNGAFRDLHRHRNCIQIIKEHRGQYGFDVPPTVEETGQMAAYQQAMESAGAFAEKLDELTMGLGQYVLPLAFRRRALFKMDAAELGYIVETRTKPAGHFSYRETAHEMYVAFSRRHPALARSIRATDPSVDEFFER